MAKDLKTRIIRIALLVGTLISLYFVPWRVVWAWIQPLPDSVQEQVEEGVGHGFDGMIVYVGYGDKAPEFYTAGWHDTKNKIPAKPDALFKIASISKLYVALSITKLVKNNQLSLNKTLAEYFPDLVERIENADKITLRQMVQHRSGIPNYTDNPKYWEDQPRERKEVLKYALDLPANFKPGEDYGYSNTNYLLLSQLIDKTIGYSYQQFIKDEILIPNQLNHTYASISEVNLDHVMSGYYTGIDYDFKAEDIGMLATAEDVGKFIRGLNNGTVFKEGEQEIYSSIYVYNHTGLIPGYQSIAEYHKESDMVVVLFTNTTNFEGYNWNLMEVIYNRVVKILKTKNQ